MFISVFSFRYVCWEICIAANLCKIKLGTHCFPKFRVNLMYVNLTFGKFRLLLCNKFSSHCQRASLISYNKVMNHIQDWWEKVVKGFSLFLTPPMKLSMEWSCIETSKFYAWFFRVNLVTFPIVNLEISVSPFV